MKVPIIASLAARAERAEYVLSQVRRLHLMDEFGRYCTCGRRYPCPTAKVLDGA